MPTNAAFGFTSMLLNLLNKEKPHYLAVAFDVKGPTFRHKEYKEYKATRTKAPDELYIQIPLAKEILDTLSIPYFEAPGFEADDLLGTLAHQAEQLGNLMTYIVTGDKDALQLITDRTHVIMPVKGFSQTMDYDHQAVIDKFGLTPKQIPDLKGLQGDSSDNIKGVEGVGAKTAQKLLQKYQTVEKIYQHIDEISGKLKERLVNDKENAFKSKELATIVIDAPGKLDLESSRIDHYDKTKIIELFNKLGFRSLHSKFNAFDRYCSQKLAQENQRSLF